jgi:PAS domain S-box-containing protein
VKKLEDEGEVSNFETEIRTMNGDIVPMSMSVSLMEIEGEKYMVSFTRDITERKLAEEKLQSSEKRFKAAFADAAIGMTLVSLDHRIIEANQAFCNMIGYLKEELVGFFITDITHPVDVDASVDHHLKLITGELDNYHIEKRYLHKQGHELWGDLSVSLVRDKDGEPLYSVAQIQDITERKRAEKALQTIAEGVSGAVGDTFFNFVVKYLAETLEVEYAFVGALIPEKNRIQTIAVHGHGKTMENFEYDLKGTPCENVVGQQFCIYEEDLQKDFPDDQLLVDMGVNSYAGGPLFDSDSRSTGIMVVLSNKPFKHVE